MRKEQKGFTLVELLVTIALMLSILGIAIVSFINISNKKKEESWKQVKSQVETAAAEYFASNEYFLSSLGNGQAGIVSVGTLVSQDYLNKVTNPITGKSVNECDIVIVQKNNSTNSNDYTYCESTDGCHEAIEDTEVMDKKDCKMNEPQAISIATTKARTTTQSQPQKQEQTTTTTTKTSTKKTSTTQNCYSKNDLIYNGTLGSNSWYTSNVVVKVKKDNNFLCKIENSGSEVSCNYTLGNKKCSTPSIKIDKSAPSISLNVYKNTGDSLDGSSSVRSLAKYATDTWYNKYTFVKVSYDAGTSGKASFSCSDKRTNGVAYNSFTGYRNVRTQGVTTIKCELKTKSGKKSSASYKIKLDRTAPKVTLTMKKKNNSTNLNSESSISGLNNYSNNTWYSGYVFTKISYSDPSATSNGKNISGSSSGINSYESSATGATDNDTKKYSYRNVNAEGISVVTYKVCDKAGNCTSINSGKIKLDRTAPDVTIESNYAANCKSFKYWPGNKVEYKNTVYIKDVGSGIKSTDYNYKYDDGWLNKDRGTNTIRKPRANTAVLSRTSENALKQIYQSYNFLENKNSTFKIESCDNAGNCSGFSQKSYSAKSSSSFNKYCRSVHPNNSTLNNRYLNQCASSSSVYCWLQGDCNDDSKSCHKD